MILIVSHKKQSTQKIEEHTCIVEYYTLPKTPKIESKGGVDIDNVNAE